MVVCWQNKSFGYVSSLCLRLRNFWTSHVFAVPIYMGANITADDFANDNMFLFCFRFVNSILEQLLIHDHNALDKRGKIFCPSTYLETESFKLDATYYYNNDLLQKYRTPKRLHVLEANIITTKKKHRLDNSGPKYAFFFTTYSEWPYLGLSQ